MKSLLLLPAIAFGAAFALSGNSAQAANAKHPYQNVDHRNDAGNDTGDSKVDALNSGQLDSNYHGPMESRAPATPSAPTMTPAR